MAQHHLKTVAITAMFISVLFLTGCGRKDTTPATTNTPTQESTAAPQNDTQSDEPATTPAATTDSPQQPSDTQTSTTTSTTTSLTSDFQTYGTPAGEEEVKVTASVDAKGIVQAVQVAYVTHAPKSKMYQDLFSEGIASQVVGKELKDVNV